jgi:membrane protein implicated in regulation of membrane protease activity
MLGWFYLFLVVLAVVGFIIDGLVLFFMYFWWLIIPALLLAAFLYYRYHPGVRAKRQLRAAAKQGNQMRGGIRSATEQAKADMNRIARDWRNRQ